MSAARQLFPAHCPAGRACPSAPAPGRPVARQPFLFVLLWLPFLISGCRDAPAAGMVTYRVHPKKQTVALYWKDDQGARLGSLGNLKAYLAKNGKRLLFAMNGGMYHSDHSPVGLYVERGTLHMPLDTATGHGNFYLKPNGVFYLTEDDSAFICRTEDFTATPHYATQSGPLLVVDGRIHPAFTKGSANLQIRNGVGILSDQTLVFAMSAGPVSFYDFALYFKNLGCTNALYLDGYVSRTYLPQEDWVQTDGDFGVLIGVTDK